MSEVNSVTDWNFYELNEKSDQWFPRKIWKGLWEKHMNGYDIPYSDLQGMGHIFWEDDNEWKGKPEMTTDISDYYEVLCKYELTKHECVLRLICVLKEQKLSSVTQAIFVSDFMNIHFWNYYGIEKPRNDAHEWEMEMCFHNTHFSQGDVPFLADKRIYKKDSEPEHEGHEKQTGVYDH